MSHKDLYNRIVSSSSNDTRNALAYAHGALSAYLGDDHADAVFATIIDGFIAQSTECDWKFRSGLRERMEKRFGVENYIGRKVIRRA